MIAVAVSKLGCSSLMFVDPDKINGSYYRAELLIR